MPTLALNDQYIIADYANQISTYLFGTSLNFTPDIWDKSGASIAVTEALGKELSKMFTAWTDVASYKARQYEWATKITAEAEIKIGQLSNAASAEAAAIRKAAEVTADSMRNMGDRAASGIPNVGASSAANAARIASFAGSLATAAGATLVLGQMASKTYDAAVGQTTTHDVMGTAAGAVTGILAGMGLAAGFTAVLGTALIPAIIASAAAIGSGFVIGKIGQAEYDHWGKNTTAFLNETGRWWGAAIYDWLHSKAFTRAKNWTLPRDPLILDLDGNGLDTVGLTANIHFDHDGDGVLTKTGWSGKNDALLVWDRNANGTIDTGAELFGDFTALPNGTLAPNGFAALAALDANGDGILDATDPAFAELKLWRDASQDGVSQGGEFITVAEAGIVSLNLANTLKNLAIGNGNTLSREGSFTRADGTVGGMGEFKLATDTFDTRFADAITVPAALQSLPNMGGSGNVRYLQQAATQSAAVAELLTQFKAAPTRAEQMALLDQLITVWADSAGMASTLEERAVGKYRIQCEAFGTERRSNNLDAAAFVAAANTLGNSSALMSDAGSPIVNAHYRNVISEWSGKLAVLEAFNGQYFFNRPANKSQIEWANDSLWECAA